MKLKELTPEQTNIWISNLNKLIDLKNKVRSYSIEQHNIREIQYNDRYSWLGKILHNDSSFDELYIGNDGYYHCFGSMFFSKIGKVDPYPPLLLEYKKVTRFVYRSTRNCMLRKLREKWEKYADRPFNINEGDLDMYQTLQDWHKELRLILEEGNLYDEAFNMDEDC